MAKASDNAFPSLLITEGTEPSAPAAGKQRLYIDSTTHVLMYTNSSGTESAVGGALGAWTSYTPTWSTASGSPNLGSSTLTGRYKVLDATTIAVNVNMTITTGGAWNAGTGQWNWSLPAGVTSATGRRQTGAAMILDSGTAHYVCVVRMDTGSTTFHMLAADASGTRIVAATVPVTWATNDQIDASFLIEKD